MQSGKMRKQRLSGNRHAGYGSQHGGKGAAGRTPPAATTEGDVRAGVFRQPAMKTTGMVLKGVARTEEEQGAMLHAARMRVAMPSVIRLLEYRRIPHQTRALSRKNILLRDRNCCQYCNVVPRSRGGPSTWENLVACCHDCNRRKGNQLLHELKDMKLQREPRPFSLHTSRHIMRMIGSADAAWRKYLYFEAGDSSTV